MAHLFLCHCGPDLATCMEFWELAFLVFAWSSQKRPLLILEHTRGFTNMPLLTWPSSCKAPTPRAHSAQLPEDQQGVPHTSLGFFLWAKTELGQQFSMCVVGDSTTLWKPLNTTKSFCSRGRQPSLFPVLDIKTTYFEITNLFKNDSLYFSEK